MRYLNPKADLTFKKVSGEHPDLVMSLPNALLPLEEEHEITDIKYLPAEMMPKEQPTPDNRLFSILIPTWNNINFLKLCIESIRKNSTYKHQIIVHINEGSDGTLEWIKKEGIDYTFSKQNIGVCLAMNMMRTKVATDYILFLNDDMYVLPLWDEILYDEIKRLPDNLFFLSATSIQPHTQNPSTILADYGDSIETFQEEKLLKEYMDYAMEDWMGATLPPNIVHRDIWDLAGGYSIEYSPGMYSDPDFTAKLYMCGVRFMKGLQASRIYHFETKSTNRIRKNCGQMQFLLKWGITSSTFRKHLTHKGENFRPDKTENHDTGIRFSANIIRSRLKALLYLLTKDFGPLWKLWEKHPLT